MEIISLSLHICKIHNGNLHRYLRCEIEAVSIVILPAVDDFTDHV